MKLSAEQIQDNWNKLIQLIEDTFEGERKEKLLEMYNHFETRMMFAPASGTEHFHLCTEGGYVQHCLNIVHYSKEFYKVWKDSGASVDDYTEEELVFAALHHDLGKVGDLDNDNYLPNPSQWHRENQGKIYVTNPNMQYMSPPDRGLWLLSHFGIKYSVTEMLGIKLADGMYDDGNIKYLKTYSKDTALKTNLPYIIHQADMATTRIEFEQWLNSNDDSDSKPKIKKTIKKQVEKVVVESTEEKKEDLQDLFKDIFGEK